MDMDMQDAFTQQQQIWAQQDQAANSRMLDLVCIMDATGSMGALDFIFALGDLTAVVLYRFWQVDPSLLLSSSSSTLTLKRRVLSTKNIEEICTSIVNSEKLSRPDDLRVSIISYRDHPPQDHSYIVRTNAFTSSIPLVKEQLSALYASGGGDGPEAVTAAMAAALDDVEWREDAAKMVVLVADAPPHGIGEYGDGFPNGSPDGKDPLVLAREMASRGITMFIVACEPALSGYTYGNDLFKALCQITAGMMLPLTTASLLSHAIVGSALEHLDMDRLIREVGQAVGDRLKGGVETVDDIARELHEKLMLRNETTKSLTVENIYRDSEEATNNVQVFSSAPDLASARPHLQKVKGSRFTDAYLISRYSSSSSTSGYRPPIPPRPSSSVLSSGGIVPATTPTAFNPFTSSSSSSASTSTSIPSSSSFSASSSAAASTSPPSRRVLSDFKAFGAQPTTSVFGAPFSSPQSGFSPRSAASASTPRGMRGGDSDDDDDDNEMEQDRDEEEIEEVGGGMFVSEGGQGLRFGRGAISFEQARRIAVGAAWRSRG
ncbi:elongation factor-2 kinase [Phaffia rhodozyma]|uniref:Elongation factor-2 kinase n=1 Tax=Phaffia rhodozyma TaxID=264483 RepID=A0A0F7SSJ3_PHARH|nr:elongation factor-2 kinase [Phaffia rhodozyma]